MFLSFAGKLHRLSTEVFVAGGRAMNRPGESKQTIDKEGLGGVPINRRDMNVSAKENGWDQNKLKEDGYRRIYDGKGIGGG